MKWVNLGVLQGIALLMFLPFDGLVSLYLVSAMFGLFQGGIVPSYAIIVREHFPPAQAGARVGAVIMATLVGMALGAKLVARAKKVAWTGAMMAAALVGCIGLVVMMWPGSSQPLRAALTPART